MTEIQKIQKQFSNWAVDELHPATLLNSALSSVLIYMLEIVFVISFAALVFAGGLASQLPHALGFILIGNAFLMGVIALFSSYAGSIAVGQDTPVAVLGVAVTAIAVAVPSLTQQYATVLMMIIFTTVMTGVLFLVLGIFKLGGLARFLPYPVMGGFLAGTGWFLTKGGISVMTSAPFGMEWLYPQALIHWLPGAILGVIVLIAVARLKKPGTLPIVLVLGGIVFFLFTSALHISLTQLQADGWLVGAIPADSLSRLPLSAAILSQVDWQLLWKQIPNLLPASIISVIALLLNLGGLELEIKKNIDLNRELIVAGIGNLCAGMIGGLVGYHAISSSTLNHKLSGGKRLVGLIAALLITATAFLGAAFLAFIPKIILGAVLVYLGVSLLYEWVYEAWFNFPRIDFAIIVSILAVIMVSGFLTGVLVGLVMAVILFVVSYSRVNIVKSALSGSEYRSRVTRSVEQQQFLQERGEQIYILKLQGFIFFGTANKLLDLVSSRIGRKDQTPPQFIILDFEKVSGLDSTAMLSFSKMKQDLQDRRIRILLTNLSAGMRNQFYKGGFIADNSASATAYPDLDRGLEWAENQILDSLTNPKEQIPTLKELLLQLLPDETRLNELFNYLEKKEVETGGYLIHQADVSDNVYFVESGQVTAQLENSGQPGIRLETMRSGRVIGEIGFYLGQKRTAAVIADQPSVVFFLTAERLAEMEKNSPEVAWYFHQLMIRLLAERTTHLIRTVEALEK